jgi:hypothetical protein
VPAPRRGAGAGEQPPSGEQGIKRVVLALTTIAAARPLALEHGQPASGEDAGGACSVARRALDRKTAAAERLRPGKQLPVAVLARKHRALVELSSEPVERNRPMRTPVCVDADGNRPFHVVASLWLENGLDRDRAVSSDGTGFSQVSGASSGERRETDPGKGITASKALSDPAAAPHSPDVGGRRRIGDDATQRSPAPPEADSLAEAPREQHA